MNRLWWGVRQRGVSAGSARHTTVYQLKTPQMGDVSALLVKHSVLMDVISRIQHRIISRQQAVEEGLEHYFTGKPCGRGHVDLRWTSSKQCVPCKRIWTQERHQKSDPNFVYRRRKDFVLRCHGCNEEIVLEGISKGNGFPFCRISDSYKEKNWCSKYCRDRDYFERVGLERNKERYHSDSEYRERVLRSQKICRDDPVRKRLFKEYVKEWRKDNDSRRAYVNEWNKSKRESDVEFKIASILRHRIKEAVKLHKEHKRGKALVFLGTDIHSFRQYLELQFDSGMTWDNHSNDGWHIDHIRPCNSFDLTAEEQQMVCFNWRNMQPLWGAENAGKRDKYELEDEQAWVLMMRDLGWEGPLFPCFLNDPEA